MGNAAQGKSIPLPLRIGAGVALVAAAFLVRQTLVTRFGLDLPPFITLYPVVMVVALLFGLWHGVLATLLAAALADYWILAPVGQFRIDRTSDAIALGLFAGMGIFMSAVAESYRRGRGRIAALSRERLADEALRASEARLELFIEHAPVSVAMFDGQMRYLYASRRWAADYGLKERELRGLSHYEVFPEISERWKEIHRRGLAGEVLKDDADRFERADHTVQWIRWEVRPWSAADGKASGIVIFSEDITERQRAEEALRASQTKLQGIVDSAMDAVISVNEEQRIIVFNRAAETIFGCPSAQALGSTLDAFIPKALRAGHEEHIRRFGQEGATSRSMTSPAILTAVRADGEHFPIEATISHLRAAGETIFTVILRDITERKRAQDRERLSHVELHALAARLQTASERERLRIARELHDQIGSALTGVKMDLEWIEHKFATKSEAWVPLVEQSISTVDSIIGFVRKLSMEMRPEMLDSAGLGAAIEWEAHQFERRTGILCSVQVPEAAIGISGDQKIAMFRIFQEAMTNIARHSRAGNVTVTLLREPDHAELTVSDDGIGFALDSLAPTTALGIVGMRERALLLDAPLLIESEPGTGTTISLRIPLQGDGKMGMHEDIDR